MLNTAAPGSYVVGDGETSAVFTGGSLLYGSVGRTDLVDPERTVELTRAVPLRLPARGAAAGRDGGLPDARLRQLLLGGSSGTAASC